MSKLFSLNYVEFYITNSCNFNCVGCNRFNNFKITGAQKWDDYADAYRRWSEILDIKEWAVLGGEPMTNPDFLTWLRNISSLWPDSRGFFVTNGYYIDPNNRELYDIIQSTNGRVQLLIGLHNINRRDEMITTVKNWLQGDITVKEKTINDLDSSPDFKENWKKSYNAIRDPSWPDCDSVLDWPNLPEFIQTEMAQIHHLDPQQLINTRLDEQFTDSNGVTVHVRLENYFHQGALILNGTESFSLHNSDPVKAHNNCPSKTCHHFDKGQLYKCSQVALFSEIDQQFILNVSDSDRELVHSYRPAAIEQSLTELENFMSNIEKPLPQCKFCPEQYQIKEIFAKHGEKIKMVKKSSELKINQ